MATNLFDDFESESKPHFEGEFLDFNSKLNNPSDFPDSNLNRSFANRSTDYAQKSHFGENSMFHPDFDKEQILERERQNKVVAKMIPDLNQNRIDKIVLNSNDFLAAYWSTDYEGKIKVKGDSYHKYRSSLEQTVYFQIDVNESVPLNTSIKFKLYDSDKLFSFTINPDDSTFNDKEVVIDAVVRNVNQAKRITLKLYLDPHWSKDIAADKRGIFKNGSVELYWKWDYNKVPWSSEKDVQLNVYPSEKKLHLKPVIPGDYSLPEIYSQTGEIILFAIDRLPSGEIKSFVSIKLRVTTQFKTLEDSNKFFKEVFTERINLETNNVEAAGYQVEELNHYFKVKDNATQIYIEEETLKLDVPKGSKTAVYNNINKTIKFAQEITGSEILDHLEVFNELRNFFPELSYNNKVNLPSLSTLVGVIPGAQVLAFGLSMVEWIVKDQMEEDQKVIDKSFWLQWQNSKKNGLDQVLNFIETDWARKNLFTRVNISQVILDSLLKGKFDSLVELIDAANNEDGEKKYFVITYNIFYPELETFTDVVDSIHLNP